MDELDKAILDAATGNDQSALAGLLVRRAAQRLTRGELADASTDLGDAAGFLRALGRIDEAAHLLQAQATALRGAGFLDEAIDRATAACALAPTGTPGRVAAETELGEGNLLAGRADAAVAAYERALSHGREAGLVEIAQAALQRRLAMAHSLAGRHTDAAEAAEEAAHLYAIAKRPDGEARARIEAATALVAAGFGAVAVDAIAEARQAAAGDSSAIAELELLEAARALRDHRAADALVHARTARTAAREGDGLLPYVAAAFTIADLLDLAGDRVGAYDSLAVGWVTAADKIGQDLAAAMFRPRVEALRASWGATEFERIKDAYYAARRT
jgi:hypothetical protein